MERGIQINRRTFSTKLINSAIIFEKQLKVFHILEIPADETYLCFVVLLLTLIPFPKGLKRFSVTGLVILTMFGTKVY